MKEVSRENALGTQHPLTWKRTQGKHLPKALKYQGFGLRPS